MAAVAPGHFSHSAGLYRPERMAEHRPSFTAVNEPATTAPTTANGSHATIAPQQPSTDGASEEATAASTSQGYPRTGKDTNAIDAVEVRETPAPSAPEARVTLAPLHSTAAAPTPSAGLAPGAPPSDNSAPASEPPQPPMSQPIGKPEVRRTSMLHDILSPPEPSLPSSKQTMTHPQKRKRSISTEREQHDRQRFNEPSPPRSPKSGRGAYTNDGAVDVDAISPRQTYPPPAHIHEQAPSTSGPVAPQAESRHSYPPPPEQPAEQPEVYPRANGASRNEYEPPLDPSIAPSQERPYYSESRLAEALQRENRNFEQDSTHDDYAHSEEPTGDEQQQQLGTYGGSREAGTADLDRKRRKRIFSNRTKTGCMTCRRRKKKCDETHPECNNCLRGGFVCEGYSVRGTWQKPASTKQPVPLQSKNGFPPQEGAAARTAYPTMSRYQDSVSDYSRQSSISGPTPQYDKQRESISEHDGVYGKPSPPSQKSQPNWVKSAAPQPYPSNPPDASKYRGNEHRGSVYDITQEREEGCSMPPPQVHRSGSVSTQYPQPAHPANATNTSPPQRRAEVQLQAQAALTQVPPHNRNRYTEREKMLLGYYFYPNTPALTEDRERCIAAIWRFNNATNPSHGASPEERIRLFRQILSLKPSPEPPLSSGEIPPTSIPLPVGKCGERVIVEAPFHCDYGYNIEIGNDVLIGADCRFSDHCQVKIGDRCILSPGVKLICATYPIDPRRRCGSGGSILGRSIIIEDDCWIGAGTTILAGVRVGKSSTVGAGSLVHQNVPRFTVAAGNPAKVSSLREPNW